MRAGETVKDGDERENLFGNLHIILRDCFDFTARLTLEEFFERDVFDFPGGEAGRQLRRAGAYQPRSLPILDLPGKHI